MHPHFKSTSFGLWDKGHTSSECLLIGKTPADCWDGCARMSPLEGGTPPLNRCRRGLFGDSRTTTAHQFRDPFLEGFQVEVNHRRDVEREELRDHQAAYHAETERTPRFAPGAITKRDGQGRHERRHGRHHDRAKAQETTL